MRRAKRTFVAASALVLVAALAASALLAAPSASAVERAVDRDLAELTARIGTKAMLDPETASSSNPYDYTDDPAFERIVRLGTPALPVLLRRIRASRRDGLREYLLAIAAERIAKVDLKAGRYAWESGKEWPALWRQHLRRVPSAVTTISAAPLPAAEKERRLVALGTPAVPFLLDRVAAGRTDLAPALRRLVAGTAEVPAPPARLTRGWASTNRHRFDGMRRLVVTAR